MSKIANQLDSIEDSMSQFFRAIKHPNYWAIVVKLSGVDIDRPSAAILKIVGASKSGECHFQDLARSLHVEAPTITRKTQSLESKGFLKREQDKTDKRVVDLKITESGKKIVTKLNNAQRQIISQTFSSWSSDEIESFTRLFEKFSISFADITVKKAGISSGK
jgi:DNA-binding MarR family transcriptional regulator